MLSGRFGHKSHTKTGLAHAFACLGIAWTLLQTMAPAMAQRGIATGPATTYEIHLRSTLKVPPDWQTLRAVRVWHAIPTGRPWSRGVPETAGGAYDVRFEAPGKVEFEPDKRSSHILYTATSVKSGSTLAFHSSYKVVSVERRFDADSALVRWSDFSSGKLPPLEPITLDSDTLKEVDLIKASHATPVATIRALCTWMYEHVSYDAAVPHPFADVRTTLSTKKGTCAHIAELLCQLTSRAGIPTRKSFGLNLQPPEGKGEIYKVGLQHTWVEFYFPNYGWVEMDPGLGQSEMFNVPARYIQNNSAFQNFSAWINENSGKPSLLRNVALGDKFNLQEFIQYR